MDLIVRMADSDDFDDRCSIRDLFFNIHSHTLIFYPHSEQSHCGHYSHYFVIARLLLANRVYKNARGARRFHINGKKLIYCLQVVVSVRVVYDQGCASRINFRQ